ncbi:hypothetical protein PT287_07520 [Lactobacillus sp. ESL0679]|uniref:hypothetical protein n=1 Tax=Lactobacillus sp. ESL0679 TaxID=2983209 RepID=UPI0023F8B840|nr:hypothetical protein [Lactobacillus sp. ESL0679]MDF7683349.1 hypothetical protein [Lactobacillus sp. ESL0679]
MNCQKWFKEWKLFARYHELFDEQCGETIDLTDFDIVDLIADKGIYDNFIL